MEQEQSALHTLKDIKQMMERSSRFISLSGLSGVAAGICALAGAWFAHRVISGKTPESYDYGSLTIANIIRYKLFIIALLTLGSAVITAFLFTYIKSKKNNTPVWSTATKRLLINFCIPLFAGGVFLLRITELGYFVMIAPGCLLFYGIALVNASKYTLGEIRYLGYAQIALGLISGWFPELSLVFWTLGFGVLHIVYGVAMWWKHDKQG
ncbi:hypothetical protein [Agriterribacter sp.]|uniref:hypothetical protein n=1 Tax=Agriterribacter sp. TaxID=2821509 RepID=UPI002B8E7AE6|nr:hypothetical protein [Agriterribacter sp.]HRP55648.1 hypothetical protein [Agriterribacter sp.]